MCIKQFAEIQDGVVSPLKMAFTLWNRQEIARAYCVSLLAGNKVQRCDHILPGKAIVV